MVNGSGNSMEMSVEVSTEVSMEQRWSDISHIHNSSMVVGLHGHVGGSVHGTEVLRHIPYS
jgi:hypothetical protein